MSECWHQLVASEEKRIRAALKRANPSGSRVADRMLIRLLAFEEHEVRDLDRFFEEQKAEIREVATALAKGP